MAGKPSSAEYQGQQQKCCCPCARTPQAEPVETVNIGPERSSNFMKPRKRGKQYEISYRCPGYDKPFYERFPTLEEAKIRCAEIELAQARGDLRPPQKITKREHPKFCVSRISSVNRAKI